MNWIDLTVIALIVVFAVVGLIRGFVMTAFKIVSFFVCIYVSVRFYPVLAEALEKTALYSSIKDSIVKNLLAWSQTNNASTAVSGTAGAEAMLGSLPLPELFKKSMLLKLPSPNELIDFQGIANSVGDEITKTIIAVISLIGLYIALRLIMLFVGLILKGVSKLPLFKQIDKLGGFVLGAVQGFLAIYILCALLVLFNTNPQFAGVFKALDSSLLAGWFYENNFIINYIS